MQTIRKVAVRRELGSWAGVSSWMVEVLEALKVGVGREMGESMETLGRFPGYPGVTALYRFLSEALRAVEQCIGKLRETQLEYDGAMEKVREARLRFGGMKA